MTWWDNSVVKDGDTGSHPRTISHLCKWILRLLVYL